MNYHFLITYVIKMYSNGILYMHMINKRNNEIYFKFNIVFILAY